MYQTQWTTTGCHRGWSVRRASAGSFALIVALCIHGDRAAKAAADGYRAYALTSVSAAQVVPELKELLATLPEPADVVADNQGSRILVQGTPQAHALTVKFVKLIDRAAEARQVSQPQLQAYRVGTELPQATSQIAWQALHKGLERLLEHGLPTTTQRSDHGETVQFPIQAAPEKEVVIEAGPASGQITLRGRPDLVRSWIQVFRLKHASAVEAKTTIDEFFNTQTDEEHVGLSVRGRVTADFRSNSLIVQASPRDLAEIAALVSRIDTHTSEAVNELRIVQLENAVAEDIVRILQYVIEQQGQAAGGGGPPGGGAGGASGRQQQGHSTSLTFLSVDNRGQKRLRSGIFTDVRITSDPRANAVVVSAPAESMGLIAGLIRVLDQIPAPEAQVKVFEVRHGDAAGMADVLGELFGQLSTGDGGATTAGTAGDPLVQMRFSVDQRTNSIIATGVEDDLAVVEAVLLRLDESDVRERQTKVYRLKSSPADAVSSAVNDWLQSERAVEQLSPGETSPFQQIQQEVVVVPEVVSNSLIVSATPRYHEEIRSLLEQLDQRPPMVNIQVLIAEVGLRDADEFGVELGLQDGLLFDRSIVESLLTTTSTFITQDQGTSNTITQDVIQSAPIAPGFNFDSTSPLGNNGGDRALANAANVAGQATSGFQLGRMNNELGYGGLVLSGTSSGVNTLLRALQATRRLEILSRPQIMTLDNQAVYIQVGQQVPRINGRSVNLGVQQNQIRDESVRIILGVTPRISPDGLLVMQIDAIKSEVGSESEGIPISINEVGDVIKSPRIDRIFAQTTVAAVSGQTIMLGGLITRRTEDTHRRVSFLSEIPVLGHLFRYDLENQQRTELLIVLTPRVVTGQADADLIKQVEAARMSWCLSDVIKLHGVSGLRGRRDAWSNDETTTVYPGATSVIAKPIPTPAHTLSPDGDQVPTTAVPISGPDGRVPAPAGHVPQALPITPPGGLTPQLKPAVPPRGASSSIRGSATPMRGEGKKTSRFVNARLKPLCNPNLEAYHRTRLERLP